MFFSQIVLALRTLFEKERKSGVVRAPKEMLHKLLFFVKLLYGGVYRAVLNTLYGFQKLY
jgi:hypothetical protein